MKQRLGVASLPGRTAAIAKAVEERGFAKVRAIDIARHAGVSCRTLYEHFANKEECIEAAFG